MARFRKMALSLHEEEDDSNMFSDGGFVLEEFQSGESDAESSDSLDEPQYKPGDKRKAAEGGAAVNSLASTPSSTKSKKSPKFSPNSSKVNFCAKFIAAAFLRSY